MSKYAYAMEKVEFVMFLCGGIGSTVKTILQDLIRKYWKKCFLDTDSRLSIVNNDCMEFGLKSIHINTSLNFFRVERFAQILYSPLVIS